VPIILLYLPAAFLNLIGNNGVSQAETRADNLVSKKSIDFSQTSGANPEAEISPYLTIGING
jgi:hypothetical protein